MHSISLRTIAPAALVSLPLLLVGCANQGITHSGFLRDDGGLRPVAGDARSLTFSSPRSVGAVPSSRRAVVIDVVDVRLPADQSAAVAPDLQARAQADFRAALEAAFSKRFTVVSQAPVGGALRVRAAITGLRPSNPTLNAITLLVIGPVSNGGVSTEAEVVDTLTDERVAAQATFTNGHLFNGGLGGYFDPLGHIRNAFAMHAEKLRELTMARDAVDVAADTVRTAHETRR